MAYTHNSDSPHPEDAVPTATSESLDFLSKRTLTDDDAAEASPSLRSFTEEFQCSVNSQGWAKAFWLLPELGPKTENATATTTEWGLLVYPKTMESNSVAVYLELRTIKDPVTVHFTIDLHLQIYPGKYTREKSFASKSTFSYYHRNYGWKQTISRDDYSQALSKPLIIECSVHPTSSPEQSKALYGCVGLINEGTTCYLNSLLQTLYSISAFRKAVYLLPTREDETETIPLGLQRVFYDLQTKSEAVSTRELLNSFGWGLEEFNTQHDVQEFNCVLSDTLERKMKGTEVEGTCAKLFEGQMVNYIECLHVDYKSERVEKFIDLQLIVKGCSGLIPSFERYVETEELKGQDLYDAEQFGKQEAKKGIGFRRFPPVLQLQLKRFEYDPETDAMGKVHDRFTFQQTIDLGKFLPGETDSTYDLLSVLIHSGTPAAGHYFAFIRPQMTDWYKFNDEIVEKVAWEYVSQCSFGGELEFLAVEESAGIQTRHVRNEMSAYMLVYIQRSHSREILYPLSDEDIPVTLSGRFVKEEQLRMRKRESDLKRQMHINVSTVTLEMMQKWHLAGLTPTDSVFYPAKPFISDTSRRFLWSIKKATTTSGLKKKVNKKLGGRKSRLWMFYPGYKDWKMESLPYDQSVGQVFEERPDSRTRALFIEVEDNAPLFRRLNSPQPDSMEEWAFLTPESQDTDSEAVFSDASTDPLEDETSLISAPLKSTCGTLVFYKWYQFHEGQPLLSVISAANISGEVAVDLVRDHMFTQYLERERRMGDRIDIYLEKAESIDFRTQDLKPNVTVIGPDTRVMISTLHGMDGYKIEHGDVLIGEIDPDPAPEGYIPADFYLAQIIDSGTVRLCYHDKYEFFPFKSFSKELIEDNGIAKEIQMEMKLSWTQKQVMERVAEYFKYFYPKLTWEQVQLYEFSSQYRRLEEAPFPDASHTRQRGYETITTAHLVNKQGVIYFDLTKYRIPDLKNGTLVHVFPYSVHLHRLRLQMAEKLLRTSASWRRDSRREGTDLEENLRNRERETPRKTQFRSLESGRRHATTTVFRRVEGLGIDLRLYDFQPFTVGLRAGRGETA